MNIISVLLFTFLCLAFFFTCKRTIWGFGFLICSRILIPECTRLTPLVNISLNTGIIVIIILFSFRDILIKRYNWKNYYSIRLFLFIGTLLVGLLLSNYKDLGYQTSRLIQFSFTDIVPVICLTFLLKTKEELILLLKVLFGATFISCMYGCITILLNSNPYVDFINLLYSKRDNLLDNIGSLNGDRGFSGTSGTFEHANGWGYFLPITFVLFYLLKISIYKEKYKKWISILLVLITICVIICSKRSALIAYFSFWCFLFLWNNSKYKIKFILLIFLLLICIYVMSTFIPQLSAMKGFIESSLFFWDDSLRDKHDIGGSSFDMRLAQITYPYYEVKDNIIFGHGFGWGSLYVSSNGFHPIMYGFETILSSAVVDGGVMGLLLWGLVFYWSFKYSAKFNKNKSCYRLLTIVQLVIALATGLNYFIFYGLYIVILNKLYLLKYNENINSDSNLQLRKRS